MANRWATDIIRRLATQTPVAYDFDTDTLKLALMATAYNPATAFTTTNTYADISASEASGTGYTATGITVPTPAWTTTQANSYGRAWTATTAYNVGDVIRPSANTNGHLYMVVTAGTTGGTEPIAGNWPTVSGKDSPTDGTVVYTEIGTSITKFSSGNIVSPSMSLTGIQYGWIYDAQNATAANQSLICLLDFGSQKTWTSTVVTFTPDTNLGWVFLTPS
jgi:hypothetical protein